MPTSSIMGRLIGLRRAFLSSSPSNYLYKGIRNLKDPEPRKHDLLCTRLLPVFSTFRHWLKKTISPIPEGQPGLEPKLECSKIGTNEDKDELEEKCIKKGDMINLNDILFTKNRDYLVRNNNEQVTAVHLKGKVIGIYFLSLPVFDDYLQWAKRVTTLMMDVYNDLQPDNNFEVVFVAETDSFKQSDSQKRFEAVFSYMPWTAIPFSDITSRKSLQRSFVGVSQRSFIHPCMFVIVDPTGLVLQCDALRLFIDYGALGYPFSDERIKYLRKEDYATAKQPSLKKLLASPNRDYVISNKGDKVPIHTFEDKLVALYFYRNTPSNDSILKELELAYEELAKVEKNFQVVLVYSREPQDILDLPTSENLFWEKFKTMPWLALPFKDPSYKKLNRIFKISYNGVFAQGGLVIFGPRAEFVEPFTADILLQYNIQDYPFTRKKAAKNVTEKVEELKLEMLWDPKTVFTRKDGCKVPFCQLAGKRVVLVTKHDASVPLITHSLNEEFLLMLMERYIQMKGTDDEFEVIHIVYENKLSNLNDYDVGDMPWLVSFASQLIIDLRSYYWKDLPMDNEAFNCFQVLVFDQDGRVVRKTKNPDFEDYPELEDFIDYDMETRFQLSSLRMELVTTQR